MGSGKAQFTTVREAATHIGDLLDFSNTTGYTECSTSQSNVPNIKEKSGFSATRPSYGESSRTSDTYDAADRKCHDNNLSDSDLVFEYPIKQSNFSQSVISIEDSERKSDAKSGSKNVNKIFSHRTSNSSLSSGYAETSNIANKSAEEVRKFSVSQVDEEECPVSDWSYFNTIEVKPITALFEDPSSQLDTGFPSCMIAYEDYLIFGSLDGYVIVFDRVGRLLCRNSPSDIRSVDDYKNVDSDDANFADTTAITALSVSRDGELLAIGRASGEIVILSNWKCHQSNIYLRIFAVHDNKANTLSSRNGHTSASIIVHLCFPDTADLQLFSCDDSNNCFVHDIQVGIWKITYQSRPLFGGITSRMKDITLENSNVDPNRQKGTFVRFEDSVITSDIQAERSLTERRKIFSLTGIRAEFPTHPLRGIGLIALLTEKAMILISTWPHLLTRAIILRPKILETVQFGASAFTFLNRENQHGCTLFFSWNHILCCCYITAELASNLESKNGSRPTSLIKTNIQIQFKKSMRSAIHRIQVLNNRDLVLLTVSDEILFFSVELQQAFLRFDLNSIPSPISKWVHLLPAILTQNGCRAISRNILYFDINNGLFYFLLPGKFLKLQVHEWFEFIANQIVQADLSSVLDLYLQLASNDEDPRFSIFRLPVIHSHRVEKLRERLYEFIKLTSTIFISKLAGENASKTILDQYLVRLFEILFIVDGWREFFRYSYDELSDTPLKDALLDKLASREFEKVLQYAPANAITDIISSREAHDDFDSIERLILAADTEALNIDEILQLCERCNFFDCWVYIYSRYFGDLRTPFANFIFFLAAHIEKPIVFTRHFEIFGGTVGPKKLDNVFEFLKCVLTGRLYPTGVPLPQEHVKAQIYSDIFGISSLITNKKDAATIPSPLVLRLFLEYDARSFLNVLNESFEDSFFNDQIDDDENNTFSRQDICNILMDIMFRTDDAQLRTLIAIFVSRSIPKYPQFSFFSDQNIHELILILSTRKDKNLRDEIELALEGLLSLSIMAYSPEILQHCIDSEYYQVALKYLQLQKDFLEAMKLCIDKGILDEYLTQLQQFVTKKSHLSARVKNHFMNYLLETVSLVEKQIDVEKLAVIIDAYDPIFHEKITNKLTNTKHKIGYLRAAVFVAGPNRQNQDSNWRELVHSYVSLIKVWQVLELNATVKDLPISALPILSQLATEWLSKFPRNRKTLTDEQFAEAEALVTILAISSDYNRALDLLILILQQAKKPKSSSKWWEFAVIIGQRTIWKVFSSSDPDSTLKAENLYLELLTLLTTTSAEHGQAEEIGNINLLNKSLHSLFAASRSAANYNSKKVIEILQKYIERTKETYGSVGPIRDIIDAAFVSCKWDVQFRLLLGKAFDSDMWELSVLSQRSKTQGWRPKAPANFVSSKAEPESFCSQCLRPLVRMTKEGQQKEREFWKTRLHEMHIHSEAAKNLLFPWLVDDTHQSQKKELLAKDSGINEQEKAIVVCFNGRTYHEECWNQMQS